VTETNGTTETIESVDTAESYRRETTAGEVVSGGTPGGAFEAPTKPFKIRKRIGPTDYEVEVYFNLDSQETLNDKILRLIRGEAGWEQT
jgi:hypothetical protein